MKKRKTIIISILLIILIIILAAFYATNSIRKNINKTNTEIVNNEYTQLDKNEIQYQENTTIEELKEQASITRKQ